MRQEDFKNALDHMIDAHSSGVTQLAYLQSCIAPKRLENDESSISSKSEEEESNMVDDETYAPGF